MRQCHSFLGRRNLELPLQMIPNMSHAYKMDL
jgi:hypothetical protein